MAGIALYLDFSLYGDFRNAPSFSPQEQLSQTSEVLTAAVLLGAVTVIIWSLVWSSRVTSGLWAVLWSLLALSKLILWPHASLGLLSDLLIANLVSSQIWVGFTGAISSTGGTIAGPTEEETGRYRRSLLWRATLLSGLIANLGCVVWTATSFALSFGARDPFEIHNQWPTIWLLLVQLMSATFAMMSWYALWTAGGMAGFWLLNWAIILIFAAQASHNARWGDKLCLFMLILSFSQLLAGWVAARHRRGVQAGNTTYAI